jgi:DNA-binding CsgD family transcriptional regulator
VEGRKAVVERRTASALSRRELEVLEMTSRGLTNIEVGERLNLSVHGVKFHLASIYRKLGVSNRTEAAIVYLRELNTGS